MVMSHNLHTNLGNWCIFPENKLIYQGKWLKPQIVGGAEIIIVLLEENIKVTVFDFFTCKENLSRTSRRKEALSKQNTYILHLAP